MRKSFIIIALIIIGFTLFIIFAKNEVNRQLKSSFLSTSISVSDSFERDCILTKYNITNQMKYILLKDLNYNVNKDNIDLDNSYVAFKKEGNDYIIYITMIGKGKYKSFAYNNLFRKSFNVKAITKNDKSLEENLNEINATMYGSD